VVGTERGIPFPVYVENPNKLTIHDPLWDEKLFQGGWMKNHPLKCGCADEWRCIHFKWPEWTGEEGEDFGREEKQGSAEKVLGDEGIQSSESNSPLREENHSLAKIALEAFRAVSPVAYSGAEIQSNTKMTMEGVQASGNNSIVAEPKRGTAENLVQAL